MNEKHTVYLAVPGHRVCWGTVTGVVNSTSRHVALPYNGGFGFSGQEDFNILWADAHNMASRGKCTHFAMFHGDITPDPSQRWLDILLEEMDSRGASLVSAISPIKDGRGLTSCGICDLKDPWRPFRRFTLKEIHQQLPETFDNRAAGYPDRPLLHNTGLWVCDLRKPCFQKLNERNELDLYFGFPTRAVPGANGELIHQRESEDWLFSRDLWLRGITDTWATRRVRLTHHGKMDFTNSSAWGSFADGDENTADKWRMEQDAKPLRLLQILEFELGTGCNLAGEHSACPNRNPLRYRALDTSKALDDETIVATAVAAYNRLGFTGLVGWVYYNEPLLEADRMFALMARIKAEAPAARFLLWTNGTLIPEECESYRHFEQIIVSAYNGDGERGVQRLVAKGVSCRYVRNPALDDRLQQISPTDPLAPCLRPFVELVIDAYGNTHLCCYDWQGAGTWGNVMTTPFDQLASAWRKMLPGIAGQQMNGQAPVCCRSCGYRWDKYQQHDGAIVERARRFRIQLAEAPACPH
jgi:hypothetical protein